MAEEANFTVLPQRTPKQKRKRSSQVPNIEEVEPKLTDAENDGNDLQVFVDNKADDKEVDIDYRDEKYDYSDDNKGEDNAEIQEYRAAAVRGHKFEYLDHTADVQLHAWGTTLREAFENVALCMFNYMTPLKGIVEEETRNITAEGHDLDSLLYHYLDELLFSFSTDFFVPCSMKIVKFDRENWKIEALGHGEIFDRQRHVSGTEIKAITYSAMQINESEGDAEVFVIVDI